MEQGSSWEVNIAQVVKISTVFVETDGSLSSSQELVIGPVSWTRRIQTISLHLI
jgi:hypothetical protein